MIRPKAKLARILAELAFCGGAVLSAVVAFAGENVGTTSQPLTLENSVDISNGAPKTLTFDIRPADGQWKAYPVAAGRNINIHCTSCSTSYFDFAMSTNGAKVAYKLRPGKRYILKWSTTKQLWDLYNMAQ